MKPNYIIIPFITILAAILGSRFTSGGIDSGWYDSIIKPEWTPSGSIIGAVWTTLFILAAISALIVWNKTPRNNRFKWIIAVFLANAVLNVFWSFLFFSQHLIGLAIWEAGLLGLSVVALVVLIRPISRLASSLLIPYAVWVAFAAFLTFTVWTLQPPEIPTFVISSFEECVSAGYPVLESYPGQCKTPDGKTFTEDIGNELEKSDLIRVSTPRPNQTIQSPLVIEGEARGFWFFEADFPVKLLDGKGEIVAWGIARTQGDWMTENFVPFRAELIFPAPSTEKGNLILAKDNPSDLPEFADELRIPIQFSKDTGEIQLYYYNQKYDEEITGYIGCEPEAILPVDRKIFLSRTPIQDTLNLLLLGDITQEEKEAGFSPMFPLEGVRLVGANLKQGTLTLEFEDPLNKTGGGSCRVRLLWAQIEKTAGQFAEVEEVKFQPEWLFQP